MKLIAPKSKPRKRLLTEEQRSSWVYSLLRVGVGIAALGTVVFIVPFLVRSTLTDMGIQWKDFQTYGLLLVFGGGLLFVLAARYFKIDVYGMTLDRLLAILRNEEYVPPSESEQLRRYVVSALSSLDNRWSLYPAIQLENAGRELPFVLVGPPGVFGLGLNTADPRKRGYVDPALRLASDCGVLQARLSAKVQAVLLLARHAAHYNKSHARVKAVNTEQLIAWLGKREASLTPALRQTADAYLRAHQT